MCQTTLSLVNIKFQTWNWNERRKLLDECIGGRGGGKWIKPGKVITAFHWCAFLSVRLVLIGGLLRCTKHEHFLYCEYNEPIFSLLFKIIFHSYCLLRIFFPMIFKKYFIFNNITSKTVKHRPNHNHFSLLLLTQYLNIFITFISVPLCQIFLTVTTFQMWLLITALR